ncbi:MAG TPA: hypothetical protein VFZ08_12740 [Terriglobia bacterium]|nr:hypothetical protein [Terriglobia bacterium]
MADPKKPHSAANAMFGLDDVPINKTDRPRTPEAQRPGGAATQPSATGMFGYPQPPAVNFGAPQSSSQARSAEPGGPEAQAGSGAANAPPGAPAPQPGPAGGPQYVYVQSPPPPPASHSSGLKWLVIILLIVAGVDLYLNLSDRSKFLDTFAKQSDQLNLLTRRADSSDERYAQLSARFQVTTERLGLTQKELTRARQLAVNIEKQQKQSVQQLNAAIAEKASAQRVSQLQSDANAKFGTISGNLAGTQKDLEATKEALTGAKGELSGAIARTHGELVALAHRTDRDYFEFTLPRKNAKQKIGSLQVQLLKTDRKHNLFTVNLFFDDKVSQRRNEAIDEPVFFYMQGAPSALELVVNKLGKNAIAGYVSAPKGFIANANSVLTARPNT